MAELPGSRVAIVTPSMRTLGGTEVYIQRLLRAQRELGLSSALFTQDAAGDRAVVDGVVVEGCGDVLSESLAPEKWWMRRAAVTELADRIAASADWVEFHRIAPLDLMRALKGRVPMLVFVHTPELTCPALGRFLPRSRAYCNRAPGPGCFRVHAFENCMSLQDGSAFPARQRLRAFTRGPVTRRICELADAVVFNSRATRDLFLRTSGAPARALVLCPPVDPPMLSGERSRGRVVFAGRIEEGKGSTDAVKVAALLGDVELHVHGAGSRVRQMAELAKQLGVPLRHQGWLDNRSLAAAFSEAECLLLPSMSFEAWGMVGPEAIAAGCPVAAYDNGGVREWLLPEYGELAPIGDVRALADAAARQIARVRGGLDTSRWRAQVLAEWGPDAFRGSYAEIIRESMSVGLDVLQIQRYPSSDYHSMELLFDEVRAAMPERVRVRMAVCPFPSRGVLPRLRALLWARRLRASVFHVTGDVHFLCAALEGRRTVLTVHDCNVLLKAGALRGKLLRELWFRFPAHRAARVTAISEATRDELARVAGMDAAAIDVVANCISPVFKPAVDPPKATRVLMVGTAANKNLERAIEALRGLPVAVDIVGRLSEFQRGLLQGLDWSSRHDLDVQTMAEAYRRATFLLFPSLAEGFGMPIVEAQASGIPVITSDVPPMNAVSGGAAMLVDPRDTKAIRAACETLLSDPALRHELSERGLRNARRFTPAAAAGAYAKIYAAVAQKKSGIQGGGPENAASSSES